MDPVQKKPTHSFFSSSKKTISMFVLLVVAVAVPITLGLIKQNQDNRQNAAVSYECPAGSTQVGITSDTSCPICQTNGQQDRWTVAECSNLGGGAAPTCSNATDDCKDLSHSCGENESPVWQCKENSTGSAKHCAHTCTATQSTDLNLKSTVAQPGTATCENVTYTWDSVTNAVTYQIYRGTSSTVKTSDLVSTQSNTTTFTERVRPLGATYYVTVRAYSDTNNTLITEDQKSFTMPDSCTVDATTSIPPTNTRTPNGGVCQVNSDCESGFCDKPTAIGNGICKSPSGGGSNNPGPGSGGGKNPGTTGTVTPTPITYNPPKALRAYTLLDTDGDGTVSVGNPAQINVPITLKKGATVIQTVNTGTNGMAAFTIRESGVYTVTAANTIHAYNSPNPATVTYVANSDSQNVYFAVKSTVTPTATKTPTGTRAPSPTGTVTTTQPAGSMTLAIRATLPGIGSRTGDNTTPRNPSRPAQVQIFNTNNEQVKNATATLTYQNGTYSGSTNISGLSAGTYFIKVSMNNTLFTQLPGVTNLVVGNNTLASIELVPGDVNQDNNLNMVDHSIFISCYGQKQCPQDQKTKSDFNDDGVIDGKDYNILIRSFAIRSGD
jgi:hypothetical protein